MPTLLHKSVAALLLAGVARAAPVKVLDPTVYKAPYFMSQDSQAYQLMVWTLILLVVIGYVGFKFVGSVDYSGDSLLHVEVERDKHDE